MPRLPFDPDKTAGPAPQPTPRKPAGRGRSKLAHVGEASQLTVTQVASLIKSTLERHVPSPLRVIGEVSNLNRPSHWYFSLKDDKAVISCVAWASAASKFGFAPKDGDEVVATGEISHYGPQGKTQLYVRKLEPVGAGALELAFRAMCEKLRAAGYFDPAHKQPLPVFPRRVAVITSAGGAAVHDVIDTARRRCPAVGLIIVDVKVQGEGAAEQIARAIRWADRQHARLGIDAILVTRGGGSMEDLWAFNEQIVADATYACSLPIVAAIGHESDTTVIELVADVRAATPTQAAMRVVPDAAQMRQQIDHLAHRVNLLTTQRVEYGRRRVDAAARHALFRRPQQIVQAQRDRLRGVVRHLDHAISARLSASRLRVERLAGRLGGMSDEALVSMRRHRLAVSVHSLARATDYRIERARMQVQFLARRLDAVDPRHVLARGYSLTEDAEGRLIRRAADTAAGQTLVTQFVDGRVRSTVDGDSSDPPSHQQRGASPPPSSPPPPRTSPSRTPANPRDPAEQMDLFGNSR